MAFSVSWLCFWLMFNFLAIRTPRSFLLKLLSSWLTPQPIVVPGGVLLQYQDFVLPLTEPHEVPVSPFLPSLWITAQTFGVVVISPHFVLPANLLRVHSVPLSR